MWQAEARFPNKPFRAYVISKPFDATLGYRGRSCLLLLGFFRAGFVLLVGFCTLLLGSSAMAPARTDLNAATRAQRRAGAPLPSGRPVQQLTKSRREKLKTLFAGWLLGQGKTFDGLVQVAKSDADIANEQLILFGRWLYETGKPYSFYSETINLFSSECPSLRRLLQPAWDLAFSWLREEPPVHHTAMPWQVLTAMITISLLYGWVRVAGVLALSWGGLAGIGEVLSALRRDPVLPEDVGENLQYVLLAVKEPKTRFRTARHQSVKVDQPQLAQVVRLAFAALGPDERLWFLSGSALRNRFKKLLLALQLTPNILPGVRDLDLGSLRAGGATWMMNVTENPDLVRRRGRWINNKVMEVYVQEVSAVLFLPRLPAEVKLKIFQLANKLNEAVSFSTTCLKLKVDFKAWFSWHAEALCFRVWAYA